MNTEDGNKEVAWPQEFTVEAVGKWLGRNFNSGGRLPALLELEDEMEDVDFLKVLGESWPSFFQFWPYIGRILWAVAVKTDNPEAVIPELMDAEEQEAFNKLPEQITIYRGCGPENQRGFSWSLDRAVAAKFPFLRGYETDKPMLLTLTIDKSRAAGLKLGRGEQEIIVFDYTDMTEEPIPLNWTIEYLEIPLDHPCLLQEVSG